MTDPNSEYPLTRASLLVQLKDENDNAAWEQFVTIYRMACKRGLQEADAQDLAQQVLMSVCKSIGRWEKRDENVRFRHWLRRVAKNAILNALTRRPKDMAAGGSTIQQQLQHQPEDKEWFEREIELEHRREIFFNATQLLKKEVTDDAWQVFQLSIIDGQPVEEVAKKTQKTVGATYAARGRLTNRLREIVNRLQHREFSE